MGLFIPCPPTLSFNGWQAWRAGPGKRPAKKKGDWVFASSKQESTLWKAAMEKHHGAGWRDALDEQEAEVAEQEQDDDEKEAELVADEPKSPGATGLGADPSGSPGRELGERLRSLPGAGTVSGATSLASGGGTVVDQLRRKLAEPFEPNLETLDRYQKRVTRLAEALEMSGEFVTRQRLRSSARGPRSWIVSRALVQKNSYGILRCGSRKSLWMARRVRRRERCVVEDAGEVCGNRFRFRDSLA